MVFIAEKKATVPRGAMIDWSMAILPTTAAMLHTAQLLNA